MLVRMSMPRWHPELEDRALPREIRRGQIDAFGGQWLAGGKDAGSPSLLDGAQLLIHVSSGISCTGFGGE